MAYTTAALCKTYMGITTSTDDTLIGTLIVRAQAMVDKYTHRTFEASTNTTNYFNSRLRDWVTAVSKGHRPQTIPAPDISNGDKVAFVKQYLKDDDETKTLRQSLARMIEQGEILSIQVKAS